MQITETSSAGLKREYRIVVGAADIERAAGERLKTLSTQVRMPGFRPGKAPVALLKKQYGKAVLGEVLEETVNTGTQQVLRDKDLRPAMQPRIEVHKFEEGSDLEYSVSVEIMPDITPTDFKKIKIERLVAEATSTEVDDMIKRLADQQKNFEKVDPPRAAEKGDAVLIDFLGKLDGTPFEGGAANDHVLELGSNTFIPGFEDQLIGAKPDDKRVVKVSFPENYGAAHLAGKAAEFDVTVKEVRAAKPVEVNDEFAKRMGLEDLAKLREAVTKEIEQELKQMSRARAKRTLLDALSDSHSFEVPPGMVDMEFDQIWQQLSGDKAALEAEMKEKGKDEEGVKAEYRAIAERRVRLGLLLAEIGRLNNLEVKPDEVTKAMIDQARRFPGQERQVMEYFQKNPEAMASLRAPLFEEKVVDFVLEMADVSEKKVSREDLLKELESN